MNYVELKRKDYFRVYSECTYRMVTVIGLYIEGKNILRYQILGEGDWPVERFRLLNGEKNKIEELEERVEKLELYMDRIKRVLK